MPTSSGTTSNEKVDDVVLQQAQKLNYLEALVLQQAGKLESFGHELERIDTHVGDPPLVAFEAQYRMDPYHGLQDGHVMLLDNVVTNHGGGYHPENGTFVAPVDGVYVLTMKVTPSPRGHVYVYLYVNDQRVDSADANDATVSVTGHSVRVIQLKRGDRAWLTKDHGVTSLRGWAHTKFAGFRLAETAGSAGVTTGSAGVTTP